MTTGSTVTSASTQELGEPGPPLGVRSPAFWRSERAQSWTRQLARWAGPVVSIAVLGAILFQLGKIDTDKLVTMMPRTPAFWAIFALFYVTGPFSEWIIYRRLWRVPASAMMPLLRKQVANEIVFGYSGEVQFYLWAREHARLPNSPFGAVKDVAVLSAFAGNIVTLVMMAFMMPLLQKLAIGSLGQALLVSVAIVVAISMAMLFVRRRLFSLPGRRLIEIYVVHTARIGMLLALSATMWHLLVPSIGAGVWLALATLRMMLSRLPFMPNKEVVMAGFVAFAFGRDGDVTNVMAFMASLIVGTHIIVGLLTSASDIATRWVRAR